MRDAVLEVQPAGVSCSPLPQGEWRGATAVVRPHPPTPSPQGRGGESREEILDVQPVAQRPDPILDVVPVSVRPNLPEIQFVPDVLPILGTVKTRPTPSQDDLTRRSPKRSIPVRMVFFCWWCIEWLLGAVAMTLILAALAAIPILNIVSLGYLLECGGRIARTGRFRDGFIGMRPAARVGMVIVGWFLMMLPLRAVSAMATAAQLIEPGSKVALGWKVGLTVLTFVELGIGLVLLHFLLTCIRGFTLANLVQPLLHPLAYYAWARDGFWDFIMSLRLPYYAWLGLRGFIGTMVWLVPPVSLIALSDYAAILGFLGSALLIYVVLFLPFLQMRFACQNRFRALFEIVAVMGDFSRAPWAFAFAFFVTLLSALPLYLLKIEMIPRELAWLEALAFVVMIYPARMLTGWAYKRAVHRKRSPQWFLAWANCILMLAIMLPSAAFYVLVVFFSQFTSWYGVASLYEQHAFLLPVPFLLLGH